MSRQRSLNSPQRAILYIVSAWGPFDFIEVLFYINECETGKTLKNHELTAKRTRISF